MPPESPAAKRAYAETSLPGGGDRLSALPDGFLHFVLYFLPAPQGVRSCVLSRRCTDLWRTAPFINIDQEDFGIPSGIPCADLRQKWRKFEYFTTNLLLFRCGVGSMDTFRLCVRGHCLRDVDRWVHRGIKYRPQVLHVRITAAAVAYPFPHLGPSCCRLKRVHLWGVRIDAHFAEQIRSRCPALQELDLWLCGHDFQEIKSLTLKRLVMHTCINLSADSVVITAPSLEYLQLIISYGCYSNGISVCVTDSLVRARICLLREGKKFSLKNQRRHLVDLCNVPDLELTSFQTKAMLNEESDKLPIFSNMRTLSFVECFLDNCDLKDKWEALGSFLQNAPCLEKLALQSCMFEVDYEMEGQIVRKSISLPQQGGKIFQCERLKFVEV